MPEPECDASISRNGLGSEAKSQQECYPNLSNSKIMNGQSNQ